MKFTDREEGSPKRKTSIAHQSDQNSVALLIVDMINDFSFQDADPLLERTHGIAHSIAELKSQAEHISIPVIYVNDNFGRWQSDFRATIQHCRRANSKGKEFVDLLKPSNRDYFVLKPMHSAFYGTCLEILLSHLTVKRLILTGIAAEMCIQFTANDAHMRGYQLYVPKNCIAGVSSTSERHSILSMKNQLHADTRPLTVASLAHLCQH